MLTERLLAREWNMRFWFKRRKEPQAVLIHLDGTSLPSEVYDECDLMTLEDQISAVLEPGGLGECDGNQIGPTETILFLYGASADAIFKAIEPILDSYPLCQNARVVLRRGGPGSPESEVRIPKSWP